MHSSVASYVVNLRQLSWGNNMPEETHITMTCRT